MARKIVTDQVFISITPAFSALNEARANVRETLGIDITEILKDNLPTISEQDESGAEQVFPAYGLDPDSGDIILDETAKDQIGSLALVTLYDGEMAPASGEGEPVAIPVAVYLLNLPKMPEILADSKLTQYREQLILNDLKLRARKMAKADNAGTSPLLRDRISALIAASARGGSNQARAYDAIFPVLQAVILQNISAKVEQAQQAGQHAQARIIRDTFSKSRLNKATLMECLSSAAGAKLHFPAMPQAQWEQLLRLAIAWAPKHQVAKLVKDEAGQTVKITDPETGKEKAKRVLEPAPQSPAIFQQWLDTRNEAQAADPGFTIDLTDMQVTLPGQPAAAAA